MSKRFLDIDVHQAALQRLRYLYSEFSADQIWLSLSGGKDSTVCFYLMKQVALELGIKSLQVLVIDLEGHYQAHSDFLECLLDDSDIDVRGFWVCLPFNLSNASSFHQPKWLCWDPDRQKAWIRPMPKHRLVVHQANHPFGDYWRKGMEFEEFIVQFPRWLVGQRGLAKVAQVIGIRTQESYNRYLKMKVKANRDFYQGRQWILKQKFSGHETYSVHPIYDWQVEDVWRFSASHPYNPVYDKMYLAGYPLNSMRICQPYGEEQRDNIELFSKIEPETWARMTARVAGGNFAKLYRGKNVLKGRIEKPAGTTWGSWTRLILNTMPPYLREHYLRRINVFLRWWRKELYQDIAHVYTKEYASNESVDDDGLYVVAIHDEHEQDTAKEVPSWRRIAKVLLKGDYLCKNLTFQANHQEYEKLQALLEKHGCLTSLSECDEDTP